MKKIKLISSIVFVLWGTSCARVGSSQITSDTTIAISNGIETITSVQTPAALVPADKICSKLDLAGVIWPTSVGSGNWPLHFALALNITGSFEGREGWKNISGNFDGQGLSLGLMQQNFGQGTLQPLLIKMYKSDQSAIVRIFPKADYLSMKVMLEDWQNSAISFPSVKSVKSDDLFPEVESLNDLDINNREFGHAQAATESSTSVQWAKNNILAGASVIPRWKSAFQTMATTESYRTFQVEASTAIFLKAKKYKETFKFTELRSLLMLYDIVVQNGGFTANHLALYNTWLAKNPKAIESQKAIALIEARLKTVNPTYAEDVRTRKMSIINGIGNVHQTLRNYPKEYCYNPLTSI